MRLPSGVSFLLIGSGIYWVLSSQLISSFTVLLPGLLDSLSSSSNPVTLIGIISIVAGLWIVDTDFDKIRSLAEGRLGIVYVIPILFAALDLYSTLASLSFESQTVELNPFVASAIQFGPVALVPFFISYLFLSQGLGLLMVSLGGILDRESPGRFVPYALICGISSFGPISNLSGLGIGYVSVFAYVFGVVGSAIMAIVVYRTLCTTALRPALPIGNIGK